MKDKQSIKEGAQVLMEFTFTMIILMLLIFAVVRVLQWSGVTLAERRMAHENLLMMPIVENYNRLNNELGSFDQIDPHFYNQPSIKALWGE